MPRRPCWQEGGTDPEPLRKYGVKSEVLEGASGRLDVDRLTKYYGALAAVQELSFSVGPGEVLGLLGPNGSGKSTTIKILTGILQPTRGRVLLDGEAVGADLLGYKASIGYVPEEPHLYSYLTGPEYLRLIGQLRGLPLPPLDAKIDRFVELLGLGDDRYVPMSSFSKGMRQKILIAAAVLHDPRIVILDEPFSGLDVTAARMLKRFVGLLADAGKMIVFSSHVLEVVEQVCSRVVILKDGRAVGADSVEHLRSLLQLPTLDAVFARMVSEEDTETASQGLLDAMRLRSP